MLRPAVSILCTLAVLAPTAAFAGDRYNYRDFDHRDFSRDRTIERVRTTDFDNRSRDFDRRDDRHWERRDARRDWERERYWRDRRDYGRDRNGGLRIIIIPRFSF